MNILRLYTRYWRDPAGGGVYALISCGGPAGCPGIGADVGLGMPPWMGGFLCRPMDVQEAPFPYTGKT